MKGLSSHHDAGRMSWSPLCVRIALRVLHPYHFVLNSRNLYGVRRRALVFTQIVICRSVLPDQIQGRSTSEEILHGVLN